MPMKTREALAPLQGQSERAEEEVGIEVMEEEC